MRNPFALARAPPGATAISHLKVVNAAAVVAIVAGYSWAARAAKATPTRAEAVQAERSQTRGAYATDGTFEGSAQGYGGTVTCRVTIENGYIESVESHGPRRQTPPTFAQAEGLTQTICDAQGTNVVTVSGATFSSAGILNAQINAALEQSNAGGAQ
ncbi:MAG: FMN-binding protein [Collinsella sp.]